MHAHTHFQTWNTYVLLFAPAWLQFVVMLVRKMIAGVELKSLGGAESSIDKKEKSVPLANDAIKQRSLALAPLRLLLRTSALLIRCYILVPTLRELKKGSDPLLYQVRLFCTRGGQSVRVDGKVICTCIVRTQYCSQPTFGSTALSSCQFPKIPDTARDLEERGV